MQGIGINYTELVERLMCPKTDKHCKAVGCYGLTCKRCADITRTEAAVAIETLLANKDVKHAHFVINWLGDCKCSNCGGIADGASNYCNWCGARFDEPEQYEE